jgi:hypothetical protein
VLALLQSRHRQIGGRSRLGRPMIAVQVALAVVLVFGAAIAARAFVQVLSRPLGFVPERVLQIGVTVPRGASAIDFNRRLVEIVGRHRHVMAAGAGSGLITSGEAPWSRIVRPGTTEPVAGTRLTLPGYLEALQIPVVRGRTLSWEEGPKSAVVSESAARALFGTGEPLGQTIDDGRGSSWRVTGVVADVRSSVDRQDDPSIVYTIPEGRTGPLTIFARTRDVSEATRLDVRRELVAAAPGSIVRVTWWTDAIGNLTAYKNPRFQTMVLASFATIALGLTAIGVFGVVSFLVAARTREMGIRLAIGARPSRLVGLMVRQTLWPVLIGLVLGLAGTRWAAALAESQLVKMDTRDPVTLALAAVVVTAAAIAAAYLPARRAARVDPLIVIKAE